MPLKYAPLVRRISIHHFIDFDIDSDCYMPACLSAIADLVWIRFKHVDSLSITVPFVLHFDLAEDCAAINHNYKFTRHSRVEEVFDKILHKLCSSQRKLKACTNHTYA